MARIQSPKNQIEKPRIARADVVAFFEERSRRIDELGPVRAVIYQDKHPDLAERRDAAEKRRISPLLQLSGGERLLDLGCGSGRWASTLLERVRHYHGVDISSGLIDYARTHHAAVSGTRFSVGTVDDFSLASIGESQPFDRILCSGVLIYLNDEELTRALACIAGSCSEGGLVLLREPMATGNRLTILQHYSEELEHNYNAIYRTQAEIEHAIHEATGGQLITLDSGDVFDEDDLNNRAETRQRWLRLLWRPSP